MAHSAETNFSETAGVTQDVGSDPTLPRSNKECPRWLRATRDSKAHM